MKRGENVTFSFDLMSESSNRSAGEVALINGNEDNNNCVDGLKHWHFTPHDSAIFMIVAASEQMEGPEI